MFKIINGKNGKAIKNAIDGKEITFDTKEDAETFAAGCARRSVMDATAWNSIRRTVFTVVAA
jgi:hypothetical protein